MIARVDTSLPWRNTARPRHIFGDSPNNFLGGRNFSSNESLMVSKIVDEHSFSGTITQNHDSGSHSDTLHFSNQPMANITKRELVKRVTDRLGLNGLEVTQQNTHEVLVAMIDEIADSLAQGDIVTLRKFGAFEVREMRAKTGRNPKNPSEQVHIPARAVVRFRPSKEIKEKVAITLQIIREREREPGNNA